MVIGMRSPPSRTRSITNCPGCADAAMSGASMRNNLVTGVSRRVSIILDMSVSRLQEWVLVHRLEPRPAAVGLGLDTRDDLDVLWRDKMAGLAHQLEPVRHGMPTIRRVRIVSDRRVAVLDFVEREQAA